MVERSKGKEFFIAPGGSIEEGETPQGDLVRELLEKFQVTVNEADLSMFGTFRAVAAGQEARVVEMEVLSQSLLLSILTGLFSLRLAKKVKTTAVRSASHCL